MSSDLSLPTLSQILYTQTSSLFSKKVCIFEHKGYDCSGCLLFQDGEMLSDIQGHEHLGDKCFMSPQGQFVLNTRF